jgi:hypothetical protein
VLSDESPRNGCDTSAAQNRGHDLIDVPAELDGVLRSLIN